MFKGEYIIRLMYKLNQLKSASWQDDNNEKKVFRDKYKDIKKRNLNEHTEPINMKRKTHSI